VISIPSSVQPHNGLPHVTGAAGGFVTRPLTSVSKTQPPASPPVDEPLPVELPDMPLEDPLDVPLPEALPDAPLEEPDAPVEDPDAPLDSPGLLLPHPVAIAPAAIVAMRSANLPRSKGLMCRYHLRPGWAS
jgi:hypothetical protein